MSSEIYLGKVRWASSCSDPALKIDDQPVVALGIRRSSSAADPIGANDIVEIVFKVGDGEVEGEFERYGSIDTR